MRAIAGLMSIGLMLSTQWASAQIIINGFEEFKGTVESVSAGSLSIKTEQGKVLACRIQDDKTGGVALSNGVLLRFPATVKVKGTQDIASLQPGQLIKFTGQVNRLGKTSGEVAELWLVDGSDQGDALTVTHPAEKPDQFATCEIIASFTRLAGKKLIVKLGSNTHTKQANLAFSLAEGANVRFESIDYRSATAGAKVTRLVVAHVETGDTVVKELEIEISKSNAVSVSPADKLAVKYRHLSDEPVAPRAIRSQHFLLMSDLSERQAAIMLDKLETMVSLLSVYFGSAPTGVIEGFVVRDLKGWSSDTLVEPEGVSQIRRDAGICFSYTRGTQYRAIIYSCEDMGVVQHEATHAYSTMAFGSPGPTWLAEGVAEMGAYWKQGDSAVEIAPHVLAYIQNSNPKKQLLEIAVPGHDNTGDWQDYAWRWALCHLLAYNPNYSDRFKPLAVALMRKQENVSFDLVYGPMAKEISFEYDQFLKCLDNGYRADLCAWQWNVKPKPLQGDRRLQKTIKAQAGWQATGLELAAGATYDLAAQGYWKIAKDGSEHDADGDERGRGKLVGAIFHDYQLSEPFPIGKRLTFKAPSGGHLVLRCQDAWGQLADNDGELTVHFRLATEEKKPAE